MILVRWIQLSTGGKVVAESMGGVRILPQTRDKGERRCLNVVEEMALAANMPVPAVYVMNHERGINAFAAGIVPADAVVAVTRGTIDHLKRSELQGVIAHEFSHILNGDMRLNIRLAAMLKGITFVGDIGHILLRSTSRVRTGAQFQGPGRGAADTGPAALATGLAGRAGRGVYQGRHQPTERIPGRCQCRAVHPRPGGHCQRAQGHRRLYPRLVSARGTGRRDVAYFLWRD